tara:strand:- start:854 stop:2227 length:1374 start_codon:yes stop_codon:yes gene_type:complete
VLIDGNFDAASLLVSDGIITEIRAFDLDTAEYEDAVVHDFGHKLIIPGLVDTHVHINEPGRTHWEGFHYATRAAAAGGITSLVDMPLNSSPVTTDVSALDQKLRSFKGNGWVDCGFWGGVVPQNIDDLDDLLDAGVLGLKAFTIESGIDEFPEVNAEHLTKVMRKIGKYQLPLLVHAELQDCNTEHDVLQGTPIGKSYSRFLASRPKSWENNAIKLLIALASSTNDDGILTKLHIVHLSSSDALSLIKEGKEKGLRISAETCPHYLSLFSEAIPDGNCIFKCCPPIRDNANRDLLWGGLADGTIDFIVSDHSPSPPELKQLESGDLENAWGGIASIQFGLPLAWTEAKNRGFELSKVVEWMSTNPAKFCGLGKRKGRLAPSFDADFVVFDDHAEYVIEEQNIFYRHKLSPYIGARVTGLVEKTYLRGNLVYSDGDIIGVPKGQTLMNHRHSLNEGSV